MSLNSTNGTAKKRQADFDIVAPESKKRKLLDVGTHILIECLFFEIMGAFFMHQAHSLTNKFAQLKKWNQDQTLTEFVLGEITT